MSVAQAVAKAVAQSVSKSVVGVGEVTGIELPPSTAAFFDSADQLDVENIGLTTDWTLAMRVRPTDQSGAIHYCSWSGADGGIYVGHTGGTPAGAWGWFDGTTVLSSGEALNNDTWYHLCVVKSGTTYSLYRDGVFKLSDTRLDKDLTTVELGDRVATGLRFRGYMADVVAFSDSKDADGVATIYANNGSGHTLYMPLRADKDDDSTNAWDVTNTGVTFVTVT